MIIVREHVHIGTHVVHNHREPLKQGIDKLTGEMSEVLVLSPVSSNELQARTPSKRHENDPKFHPDAPLIKANKLTEENLAKQNFDLEGPGRLYRPLQAVRPPLPENLLAGQTSTSQHPISRITPWIVAKLRE
jgi:hypothetical protein